jgi:anhydro-N-acetylmuramic acid kinase
MMPNPSRNVVGVMTGTSIDGIDAALVRIEGHGLNLKATCLGHCSRSLGELRPRLRAAADQTPMSAGKFAQLAWDFGGLHVDVIRDLLKDDTKPDLICAHGQTVFHQPPVSWQLLNPAPIAAAYGCKVICDLRQADLAAGGQGAPITPIADWIVFNHPRHSRAIVNLGGFCNVTILPADATRQANMTPQGECEQLLQQIRGFDVCACNHVLDAVARELLGIAFDEDGRIAASADSNSDAVARLEALLTQQRHAKRSLGTGDELTQWIAWASSFCAPAVMMRSAVDAVARVIGNVIENANIDEAILAGGGARNRTLVDQLRSHVRGALMLSDDLGVPLEARESMEFAVLGALCEDGVPITLPQVTGCKSPAPLSGVMTWARRAD